MSSIDIKVWVCVTVLLGPMGKILSGQFIQIDTLIAEDIPAVDIKYTNNNAITIEHARFGVQVQEADIGFRVDNAVAQGFEVLNAGNHGVQVSGAGAHGFTVSSAGDHGFRVGSAGINGLHVEAAGRNGVVIDIAERDGYYVGDAGRHGLYALETTLDALHVVDAGRFGLFISDADSDAIRIAEANANGILIQSSNQTGISINDAVGSGLVIGHTGNDGVFVANADSDGLRVANADGYAARLEGEKVGSAQVRNHITRIFNRHPGSGGDVLALQVNNHGDVDHTSNFITFFKGGTETTLSNAIGAIEGNGSGGITFKTSGADFAETLSQIDPSESIHPGDVVGVYAGKISLQTKGADQVMVITDRPAILGNSSEQLENTNSGNVSFIGQVPVRVQGPVKSGDWLVQSGKGDGTAKVMDVDDLSAEHMIIGQAWEHISDREIRKINVAIGIGYQQIYERRLNQLNKQLTQQQLEIESLKNQMREIINQIK